MNWFKYIIITASLSFTLVVFSVFALIRFGLPLTYPLTGATLVEWSVPPTATLSAQLKQDLSQQLTAANLPYTLSYPATDRVQIQTVALTNDQLASLNGLVATTLKTAPSMINYTQTAASLIPNFIAPLIITLTIAALGALMMITWRWHDWRYALATGVTVAHNAVILTGLITALGRWGAHFDPLVGITLLSLVVASMMTTLMTLAKYRSEQRLTVSKTIGDVANRTITQMLVPLMQLSVLMLLPAIVALLIGGSVLRWPSVLIVIGVQLNFYASVLVAVPLIAWANKQFPRVA
jgi:preprotein translocase subunit SecF